MATHTIFDWNELANTVERAEVGDIIELNPPQQRNQNVFRVELKDGVKQAVSIRQERNNKEVNELLATPLPPVPIPSWMPKRKVENTYTPRKQFTPNGKKPRMAPTSSENATQQVNWSNLSNSNSNEEPHGQRGRARLRSTRLRSTRLRSTRLRSRHTKKRKQHRKRTMKRRV